MESVTMGLATVKSGTVSEPRKDPLTVRNPEQLADLNPILATAALAHWDAVRVA